MDHMQRDNVRSNGVSPASSLSSADFYEIVETFSPKESYSPKFSLLSNQGSIKGEPEPPFDVWNGLKTKPGVAYTKNSPDPSYLSTKDLENHPKNKKVIPIDRIGPGRLEILPDKNGGYTSGPSYSQNDMAFSPLSCNYRQSPYTPPLSQNPPLPMLAANGLSKYDNTPSVPKSNLRHVVNNEDQNSDSDDQDNVFLTQINRSVSAPVGESAKIIPIIPNVANKPKAIAPINFKHLDLKRDTGTKLKLPAIMKTLKK